MLISNNEDRSILNSIIAKNQHSGFFLPTDICLFEEQDEHSIVDLIEKNLWSLHQKDRFFLAMKHRMKNLINIYKQDGCKLFVIKDRQRSSKEPIACVGLGPLHGLPVSENIGEIRDLVVCEDYRGIGLGKILLNHCIKEARSLDYKRLYLETTPGMITAQKLFEKRGFRPVKEVPRKDSKVSISEEVPCYFLLETLE